MHFSYKVNFEILDIFSLFPLQKKYPKCTNFATIYQHRLRLGHYVKRSKLLKTNAIRLILQCQYNFVRHKMLSCFEFAILTGQLFLKRCQRLCIALVTMHQRVQDGWKKPLDHDIG